MAAGNDRGWEDLRSIRTEPESRPTSGECICKAETRDPASNFFRVVSVKCLLNRKIGILCMHCPGRNHHKETCSKVFIFWLHISQILIFWKYPLTEGEMSPTPSSIRIMPSAQQRFLEGAHLRGARLRLPTESTRTALNIIRTCVPANRCPICLPTSRSFRPRRPNSLSEQTFQSGDFGPIGRLCPRDLGPQKGFSRPAFPRNRLNSCELC